jgi:hypothetical protein
MYVQRKKMNKRWKTQKTKTINREKIRKNQKQKTISEYFGKMSHGNGKPSEEHQVSVESNNVSGASFLE